MKIRLVVPLITEGLRLEEHLRAMADPDTEITAVLLDSGPASIEGEMDKALAVPGIIKKAIEAEREGCDAIVIDCMGDPGLDAAREAVGIPIFSPGQTCMHIASIIGHRFSVITMLRNLHPLLVNQARLYGLAGNMAPVRSVDIPVLELDKDLDRLRDAFIREAVDAVNKDEADVLIFGCTGMHGMVEQIETGLREAGITGIPIIDPAPITVKFAAAMIRAGLIHNKMAFPFPRQKTIKGYDISPVKNT